MKEVWRTERLVDFAWNARPVSHDITLEDVRPNTHWRRVVRTRIASVPPLSLRSVLCARASALQRLASALALRHLIAFHRSRRRRHLDYETASARRLHLRHFLRLDTSARARATCNSPKLASSYVTKLHITTGVDSRWQQANDPSGSHARRRRVIVWK